MLKVIRRLPDPRQRWEEVKKARAGQTSSQLEAAIAKEFYSRAIGLLAETIRHHYPNGGYYRGVVTGSGYPCACGNIIRAADTIHNGPTSQEWANHIADMVKYATA